MIYFFSFYHTRSIFPAYLLYGHVQQKPQFFLVKTSVFNKTGTLLKTDEPSDRKENQDNFLSNLDEEALSST